MILFFDLLNWHINNMNYRLSFPQVLHLPVNPTSSSVKMAAVPSSFGAAMGTTTATTTLMKRTAVSCLLRLFWDHQVSLLRERINGSGTLLICFLSMAWCDDLISDKSGAVSLAMHKGWKKDEIAAFGQNQYKATTRQTTYNMLISSEALWWVLLSLDLGCTITS